MAGANATVTTKTAYILKILDDVEPVLMSLQTRLATVYDSIRAQHAIAQAKINADVRKGIAEMGDEGLGEVSKEKILLEALVAENMADPEKDLTMLQARLNALDTDFRNDLSAEKELHGNLHSEVRVRLGQMEREVRESNSNLTSYMDGLKEELDEAQIFKSTLCIDLYTVLTLCSICTRALTLENLCQWKTESERALSQLETKQGDDKSTFLKSLGATKSDVEGRNSSVLLMCC